MHTWESLVDGDTVTPCTCSIVTGPMYVSATSSEVPDATGVALPAVCIDVSTTGVPLFAFRIPDPINGAFVIITVENGGN